MNSMEYLMLSYVVFTLNQEDYYVNESTFTYDSAMDMIRSAGEHVFEYDDDICYEGD